IRLDQGLEASGNVRGVADHGMLPHAMLPSKIANHYQAGGDSNADPERFSGPRFELRHGGDDIKRCPHGALGIVLVRTRIAGIYKYSVPSEVGNKPVI